MDYLFLSDKTPKSEAVQKIFKLDFNGLAAVELRRH